MSIAYQVVGDGPIDLVWVPGIYSHLEFQLTDPSYAQFVHSLAAFSRLILFDKRGTGMSDRDVGIATLEERMDDVRSVMDAAGSDAPPSTGLRRVVLWLRCSPRPTLNVQPLSSLRNLPSSNSRARVARDSGRGLEAVR